MKTRNLLFLGLAAMASTGFAGAQTVIRVTGSTAFRGSALTAIGKILNAGYTYGYNAGTLNGSTQAVFKGTTANGSVSVIIKTSFNGSVAGYQAVNDGANIAFLADGVATSTGGTANLTTGAASEVPLVALSDVYTSSVTIPVGNLTEASVGPVGVVPFKWVASTGAPAGLNNMTPQIAQALFPTGSTVLATFTGVAGDLTTNVYAIGRDFDSGTRLTAFAETGVGTSLPVKQYQPTFSGATVASHIYWPAYSLLGLQSIQGNGGYSSGGNLADAMRYTTAAIGGYYVTYLGLSDANRALTGSGASGTGTGNAKELTYNGVPYSTAAVQNGQYTFWGYEHLVYHKAAVKTVKDVANSIATQIHDTDATVSGIDLGSMSVSRTSDGGTVGF